jgi:FMN-dependent NADH-azoreductase
MKLLHIDASILGDNSVSRQISAAVVDRLKATTPNLEIVRRDLAADPLEHIQVEEWAALRDPESRGALAEFLAADIVVIGAPMYNFGVPSQLKAWVDRICVAGKTFSYSAEGPKGLAGDKRVIVAISRGNFYGPGAPAAAFEHVESYLHTVFGFIGVTQLEVIVAEGVNAGPEHREKAMTHALGRAAELAAA